MANPHVAAILAFASHTAQSRALETETCASALNLIASVIVHKRKLVCKQRLVPPLVRYLVITPRRVPPLVRYLVITPRCLARPPRHLTLSLTLPLPLSLTLPLPLSLALALPLGLALALALLDPLDQVLALFEICAEDEGLGGGDEDEDELSLHKLAAQVLDVLGRHLPSKHVVPAMLEQVGW